MISCLVNGPVRAVKQERHIIAVHRVKGIEIGVDVLLDSNHIQ